MHTRGKPALGASQAIVESGPVNILCMLGEDDGCALEPEGFLARLEDQLRLVVPPRAIGGGDDGLAVGGDGGDRAVEYVVLVVSLRAIFYLRVAPMHKQAAQSHTKSVSVVAF